MDAELRRLVAAYLEADAENKRLYTTRSIAARMADDRAHGAGQAILAWLRANPGCILEAH